MSSSRGFLPRTDAGLLEWAQGFSPQITSSPTSVGLTAGQASDYASDLSSYAAALILAKSENTRTKGTIAAKDSAKLLLRQKSMQLAAIVRAFPGITDQQLEDLGLNVRNLPSPITPPNLAPVVTVKSVTGRTVIYNLRDATTQSSRRRPFNAQGCTIMSFVGAVPPPENDPGWKIEGQTGRTVFAIQYPDDVQPGTPVWVTAVWYSPRGQYSPASAPLSTYLAIGPAAEAA